MITFFIGHPVGLFVLYKPKLMVGIYTDILAVRFYPLFLLICIRET